MKIQDGTGRGASARVTLNNKLDTRATTENQTSFFSVRGDAYILGTGVVNLTSATESALLYISNDEDFDLHVTEFVFLVAASTSGTGKMLLRVVKNPTGGTLISGGTEATLSNKNYGANKTLLGSSLKGVEGSTITGGSDVVIGMVPAVPALANFESINHIVPKGSSMAIAITPPTSNSSMDIIIVLNMFLQTEFNT